MKTKTILNTDIVVIKQDATGLRTFVKMQDKGWLEMATFQNDLKGLVNALDLATNCCAGKFYPKTAVQGMTEIDFNTSLKMLENKKGTSNEN